MSQLRVLQAGEGVVEADDLSDNGSAPRYSVDWMKSRVVPVAVEARVANADGIVDGLTRGELVLAAHLGKYFNRRVALTLRDRVRIMKREYDESGDDYKTPFALDVVKDPTERAWLLANFVGFGTTHGCTGGCSWCCYDALPLGSKDLEVVPLEQKKHFFDELYRNGEQIGSGYGEYLLKKLFLHLDTDTFDDPDIVEVVTHLYGNYGAVPQLSTVIPKSGEQNFKMLTELSMRYLRVDGLARLFLELTKVKKWAKKDGLKDFSEVLQTAAKQKSIEGLMSLVGTLRGIAPLQLETKVLVLKANEEKYNEALAVFGLGTIDDCVEAGEAKILEIERVINDNAELKTLATQWPHVVDLIKKLFSEDLSYFGIDGLEELDFNEAGLKILMDKILKEKEALEALPNAGRIRVSAVKHRMNIVRELWDDPRYYFSVEGRDNTPKDAQGMRLSGLDFYRTGEEVGEYGISCANGMELSPYGVLATVAGKITHAYPQGRALVPYKGFLPEAKLATVGSDVAELLENVIVLQTGHYGADKAPEFFHVFDGSRVRKITFDQESYKVISDEVVMEDVESVEAMRNFRKLERH